jgi:hypothetical protein
MVSDTPEPSTECEACGRSLSQQSAEITDDAAGCIFCRGPEP